MFSISSAPSAIRISVTSLRRMGCPRNVPPDQAGTVLDYRERVVELRPDETLTKSIIRHLQYQTLTVPTPSRLLTRTQEPSALRGTFVRPVAYLAYPSGVRLPLPNSDTFLKTTRSRGDSGLGSIGRTVCVGTPHR